MPGRALPGGSRDAQVPRQAQGSRELAGPRLVIARALADGAEALNLCFSRAYCTHCLVHRAEGKLFTGGHLKGFGAARIKARLSYRIGPLNRYFRAKSVEARSRLSFPPIVPAMGQAGHGRRARRCQGLSLLDLWGGKTRPRVLLRAHPAVSPLQPPKLPEPRSPRRPAALFSRQRLCARGDTAMLQALRRIIWPSLHEETF